MEVTDKTRADIKVRFMDLQNMHIKFILCCLKAIGHLLPMKRQGTHGPKLWLWRSHLHTALHTVCSVTMPPPSESLFQDFHLHQRFSFTSTHSEYSLATE